MSAPDPTGYVMRCLLCSWQVDAPPRARASLGINGLMLEIAQAHHLHHVDAHADSAGATFAGQRLEMADGKQATAGLAGIALPRWWQWITTKGTR